MRSSARSSVGKIRIKLHGLSKEITVDIKGTSNLKRLQLTGNLWISHDVSSLPKPGMLMIIGVFNFILNDFNDFISICSARS